MSLQSLQEKVLNWAEKVKAIPRHIYVNQKEDGEWFTTDDYGRLYNNGTIHCENDLGPCLPYETRYCPNKSKGMGCVRKALNDLKRVVDGRDPTNVALLYCNHSNETIKVIALTILRYGKNRIRFRKKGRSVYVSRIAMIRAATNLL